MAILTIFEFCRFSGPRLGPALLLLVPLLSGLEAALLCPDSWTRFPGGLLPPSQGSLFLGRAASLRLKQLLWLVRSEADWQHATFRLFYT